jgi:tetratricopeptide (TPR) repeat protein
MHPLSVFISSTSDLRAERDAVEATLSELDVDGSRFESWVSSPNHPMEECLRRIKESDAVVLLLGSRYGRKDESGLSPTHQEYREARKLQKRVFPYVLHAPEREEGQDGFIQEVKADLFLGPIVRNAEELKLQVRRSLVGELTRCFREVHCTPDLSMPASDTRRRAGETVTLPGDPKKAYELLADLYEHKLDYAIQEAAGQCETRFHDHPQIMNFVYMAEVNIGMDHPPLANLGRVARAVEFWESVETEDIETEASRLYNVANALVVLGRHKAAIERYRESLAKDPLNAKCWKNLGSAYLHAGNAEEARSCYELAVKIDPLLFQALYCLATLILQQDGDAEQARSYLDRIITAELETAQVSSVYGWQAVICLRTNRYPEGIARIEDALAMNPGADWAWACAGRLYALVRHEGNEWLGRALEFWGRFLERFPDKAEAWAETGYLQLAVGRACGATDWSEGALRAFEKAVSLGIDDGGLSWDRIGHIHQERGQWAKAEQAFRKACQENPGDFGYCLGLTLITLGRHEEALPLIVAAAEKHQPDAFSWFQVGLCCQELGRFDEAVNAYEKAINLDPDYPPSFFNLGGLYFNRGDRSRALSIWRDAVKRFPNHELCHELRDFLGPDASILLDDRSREEDTP